MILATLALVGALWQQDLFPGVQIRQDILTNKDGSEPRLMIRQPQAMLPKPKRAPKISGPLKLPYEFDWITWGFVRLGDGPQHDLRFRVYSQEHKPEGDVGLTVARMLLRLWDLNHQRLNIDHSEAYWFQLQNVYITYGGEPGGEQFVSADIEGTRQVRVNNIVLYDLASFTEPIEMAREIAHEYGHAILPPVGGYKAPENWANGYLGEKLYLSWIRDILAKDALAPEDFAGATLEQVSKWVAANVDPLVLKASATKPTMAALADKSKAGMDTYLGLVLYMSQILPEKIFARTLKLTSQDARDYIGSVQLAVEEPLDSFTLKIPDALKGKTIWVPTSKGGVSGAKVLAIEGGWTQIQVGTDPILIKPRDVPGSPGTRDRIRRL